MKWIAFATHLKTGHAIISLMVPFEHSVLTISNFATYSLINMSTNSEIISKLSA